MSVYDIPPRALARLDQEHARADERLGEVLADLAADGIATFDSGTRSVGVALALRDLDPSDLLEIATAAVARVLEEAARRCVRCDGSGTVHVATYGGHDVACGMCRGSGQTGAQQ
jgi:hypothetical protein